MHTLLRAAAAFALIAAIPAGVFAHAVKTKTLEIIHPWTYGLVDGRVTVQMTIKNIGKHPDRLVAIKTPLAASTSIVATPHAPAKTSRGKRPATTISVVSGQSLDMTQAGPHLLLSGFTKELSPYDSFPVTLVFEHAGPVEIEVLVEERTAASVQPHR